MGVFLFIRTHLTLSDMLDVPGTRTSTYRSLPACSGSSSQQQQQQQRHTRGVPEVRGWLFYTQPLTPVGESAPSPKPSLWPVHCDDSVCLVHSTRSGVFLVCCTLSVG